MAKPLFSIIVPVYKIEKYIEICVHSIENQGFSNYEIILIDDGSPDNCPQICDSLARESDQIKVIHKDNAGVSKARGEGINAATGDYVIFIDGDDYITEGCLPALAEAIEKTGADIICHGMKVENKQGVRSFELPYRFGYYEKMDIANEIFPSLIQTIDAKYFPPSLCGKAIKRELFMRYNLVDEKATIGEDGACIIPCIFHANSMYLIKECFYFYRYNDNSATKGKKVFNWDWPEIVNTHIAHNIDLLGFDFVDQLNRKIVHDVFNVIVSQFNRNESYLNVRSGIKEELRRSFYHNAIRDCRFGKSLRTKLMEYAIRFHLLLPILLFSKVNH
jgi:glycosyltransferase involved in cell wall biosynthesis